MRNKLLGALVVVAVVVGSLFAFDIIGNKTENPVNYVSGDELTEMMDDKKTFAFVIGDNKCPACGSYMSGAQTELFEKDEVMLYYMDIDKLTNDTRPGAQNLVEDYLDGDFQATPTTYFIVDGEVAKVSVGVLSYEELSATYKEFID